MAMCRILLQGIRSGRSRKGCGECVERMKSNSAQRKNLLVEYIDMHIYKYIINI